MKTNPTVPIVVNVPRDHARKLVTWARAMDEAPSDLGASLLLLGMATIEDIGRDPIVDSDADGEAVRP